MYTETDITQPQRLIPHIMKEMSVFVFIPLGGIVAKIDATVFSTVLTSVIGAIVGLFAIVYYIAQTKKSNAERKLIELELAEKELEITGKRKRKPNNGDGDE